MDKKTQNALSMWRAVRLYLDGYNKVWEANAPFKNASAELTEAINQALDALQAQTGSSKGFSGLRAERETRAIDRVVAIARCAGAYALDTGNSFLLTAMNEGKGRLRLNRQNTLLVRLRDLMQEAMQHREALLPYGVTDDMVNAAEEALKSLEEFQAMVRTTITAKKAVTGSVPAIMKSGSLALAKMDRLVHIFEPVDAGFVSGYKAVRTIVHAGTRHKEDDTKAA